MTGRVEEYDDLTLLYQILLSSEMWFPYDDDSDTIYARVSISGYDYVISLSRLSDINDCLEISSYHLDLVTPEENREAVREFIELLNEEIRFGTFFLDDAGHISAFCFWEGTPELLLLEMPSRLEVLNSHIHEVGEALCHLLTERLPAFVAMQNANARPKDVLTLTTFEVADTAWLN